MASVLSAAETPDLPTEQEMPWVPPRRRDRWPRDPIARWAVRTGLSLPYLALAWLVVERGVSSRLNAATDEAGAAVEWGASTFGWVSEAYPPIPVGIAGVLPWGTAALSVVGALAAGPLLHSLVERLVRRDVPVPLVVLLIASVALTPLFGYLATEDLSGFLALALLVVALEGFLRFVTEADTEGGFQAGLLLGVAAACDVSSVVFALLLGASAPFVARARYRGVPAAGRATAAVLAFPAVAALLGWAFLEWRFSGTVLDSVLEAATVEHSGDNLGEAAVHVARTTLHLPLFYVCGALLTVRRPAALIAYLMPLPGLVVAAWLGLHTGAGATVVILSGLALLAVPARPSRGVALLLGVAAVAQVVVVWLVVTPNRLAGPWIALLF
ncbi:hypothetical protein JQN72_09310 [Phycicoccus sp. CSK15P-2]|uniref:hypothetical protein n=1 Tax=Phycicoccus sp. CSK15P-2 TaxID=2807627 RepID=UPI001952802F|nr:hypothetical protein [Phycicoccus sp. CSK15P-2]MBM6404437.1 hypothetical protein [Phycicoccus sp. CSK15P-2]